MLIDVSVLMPASSVASSLPPPLEQAARASTLVAATAASAALRVILNFPPEKGGGLCGDSREKPTSTRSRDPPGCGDTVVKRIVDKPDSSQSATRLLRD